MKTKLTTTVTLTQNLTPQQIQYLKLLQMPIQQLEQKIEEELQENPLLEALDTAESNEYETVDIESEQEPQVEDFTTAKEYEEISEVEYQPNQIEIDEARDPFDIFKRTWQDDEILSRRSFVDGYEDEDQEPLPIKQTVSFFQEMIPQIRMIPRRGEELLLGEQILGNVDPDGYLRTPLQEIVDDTNELILEKNL
ncbi:MAG: hypothetical protein ACK4SO_04440, partial [Candidatus Kapaibacteriota bacterium]